MNDQPNEKVQRYDRGFTLDNFRFNAGLVAACAAFPQLENFGIVSAQMTAAADYIIALEAKYEAEKARADALEADLETVRTGMSLPHLKAVMRAEAAEQRVREVEADARRWQFVRQKWGRLCDVYRDDGTEVDSVYIDELNGWPVDPETLDAAIDAAIAKDAAEQESGNG